MLTKQDIIEKIIQTAKENGGRPLGYQRFKKETGTKRYDWKKFWARFGDAQKEAGFLPNQLQGAYDDKFIFEKVIDIIRKLGKFPTYDELHVEKTYDNEFPSKEVFYRFGTKEQLVARIVKYCKEKEGLDDVIELCEPIVEKSHQKEDANDSKFIVGEVYLFKSGKYYKIGKINDTVRRGSELRIQLPERINLIHSIKTDDSGGVEAYWHKRFEEKRMNGEWFNLNSSDIKAFRCWKRIV